MKFTLKDYQNEAVRDVLENLKDASFFWHDRSRKTAFSLAATTGAGKTVMAAAVFEALFYGDDDFDFAPDPSAVVIWFSDDPSLNEQSRFRLTEASDKLKFTSLVNVGNTFSREKLEPGKIYFLNTQKLSKKSLLVRGHDSDDPAVEKDSQQMRLMPDLRSHTIWDTIQNTIEDPDLTLYLLLDEAHRGMKEGGRTRGDNKPTIVKQLINGKDSVPGIPVVWGISATVERFNEAIKGMNQLTTLPNVIVDSTKVQESGLLKDTIKLDVPDKVGDFSTVLLRRGTDKLREISKAWEEYAKQQSDSKVVQPLMILQVPNSPNHSEVGRWLDVMFDRWPNLPVPCIANVFGEHKTEKFGRHIATYITPERVQESDWVRILIAKDAISTGWDCPRAEVMVSFRAASDKTHITQLLGRMVRTPLARRIPGNERLNAVDCLLPHFNKTTVEAVVLALMTGGGTGENLPGRRVLINPHEMKPNPVFTDDVWEKLQSLPSQTLPKRQAKPVKRLTSLAHELAADGLLSDAGKTAHARMHKQLDLAQAKYATKIKKARNSVLIVDGKTVIADIETSDMTFDDFVENADYAVIEDSYKRACRLITPDLARTYSEYLANKASVGEDLEDALIEAHTIVASIGLISEIKDDLEVVAEKLSKQWLKDYREEIKKLSDDRQDVYRQIREMSTEPLDIDLAKPTMWLQPTTARDPDGNETDLPKFEGHLLCDIDGYFPEYFNSWEKKVLLEELRREEPLGWYRNPSRASQDSLGVTYKDGNETFIVRPDFIFFVRMKDGSIAADIVDPHGYHLADALPKLKGLSRYAEVHGAIYRRIETVAEVGGHYRLLDLKKKSVRDAIDSAPNAKSLYESVVAANYQV